MNMSPVFRVVLSNIVMISTLAAIWCGQSPLLLFLALPAYAYLHSVLKPRIPSFTNRGHSLPIRLTWSLLIISLAAVYFAVEGGFLSRKVLQISLLTIVPILLLGSFFDDVRFARKLAKS
jgi:hypothetical protein